MSMLSLSAAADALYAVHTGPDADFARVVTDSRQVRPGDLFVALKGERFDAHDFVADVLAAGAVGAVVRCDFELDGASLIKVPDTRIALGHLAARWRRGFDLPLAGITGSNGKTTVKEMLRAILVAQYGDAAVLATHGNLNNDIGQPLTLLQLSAAHRAAVIEMGMNHAGELSWLSGLARPRVALVNNAMRAHIGYFGSVEAVARAKAEIYAGLPADGVAVLNADDPHADLFRIAAAGRRRVEFGLTRGDVHARDLVAQADGSRFTLVTAQGEAAVTLHVPGDHMVANALAAAAVALALGASLADVATGLDAFAGVAGRLAPATALNGAAVIDDTYNANPDSVHAAIRVLAGCGGDTWLVFGDIGELGAEAPALHAEIGRYAREHGIRHLVTIGEHSAGATQAFGAGAVHGADIDAVLQALAATGRGSTVLVKGSRFMKLERVVAALTGKTATGH